MLFITAPSSRILNIGFPLPEMSVYPSDCHVVPKVKLIVRHTPTAQTKYQYPNQRTIHKRETWRKNISQRPIFCMPLLLLLHSHRRINRRPIHLFRVTVVGDASCRLTRTFHCHLIVIFKVRNSQKITSSQTPENHLSYFLACLGGGANSGIASETFCCIPLQEILWQGNYLHYCEKFDYRIN